MGFIRISPGITPRKGKSMGNFLKKLFSSFVALATIGWSVGIGSLALPSMAHAVGKGMLVKASGPAVYYKSADNGQRYVFPNEKTYFSWYRDFSGVVTISDAELAAIPIGGNVTIRPGTKLVKITTDPKVYAVTLGGMLHWVESEAIATQLYGASWAGRVVDVPDSFFVNYTIGSSVSTAVHPNGSLIKYAGSPDVYVVWDGMKRHITSEAVMAANGFNGADVLDTAAAYPDGTDLTGRENMLADVIYIPGGSVSGDLNVTLASDTPAGMTVPNNSASVRLAKWNFTAGSAGATITNLTVHRVGVGSPTDLSNVYLYKADGTRISTGRTINSSTNNVQFNNLGQSVAPGATIGLELWGDFSSPAATGGEHAFEILDAASTVVSESGISITGNFPVRGNTFVVGTSLAGRLDVQKGTTPTDPSIGSMDVEISNFKLTANTNDIEVRRITLLQAGSITNTDLSNLKLWQGSTQVATAASLSGDKIVLTFTPPFVLTNGSTRTFRLTAHVSGRSGRTIKTYVEYTTDVYAVDLTFNSGAAVCIADTAIDGCTAVGQGSFDGDDQGTAATTDDNAIILTTQGGVLTTAFNGPAASNVAKGKQDVVLYRFALTSSESDLEIRRLYFTIAGLAGTDLVKGSAGTEYFRDLKVRNADTGAVVMGPISMPAAVANSAITTGVMTMSDPFSLPAGTTINLEFTADLSNTEDAPNEFFGDGNNQYRVVMANASGALFGSSDVRIVDTGEFLATTDVVPNTTINGNYHTVKASSLSVALASSPSSGSAVLKQANIPSVGLTFTSGDQSEVLIRSVKLTGIGSHNNAFWSATTTRDIVTSCGLFDGTTQLGASKVPDATTGEMNITSVNAAVPSGGSKTLTVKCTADSTVEGAADYYAIGVAAAVDVTADDDQSNSITSTLSAGVVANTTAANTIRQTVRNGGTLTIQTDGLRQSTILVAGGDVWHNLSQFKATAQYEAINLTRVRVTSTGDAANYTAIGIANAGVLLGQNTLSAGVAQAKDVDLTTPISIPMNGSATFQVWAKLASTQSSSSVGGATTGVARSGNTFSAGVAASTTSGNWDANYNNMFNVRAVGQASGDVLYGAAPASLLGNVFVLRKSKPTVTKQSGSTTLSNGSANDLYKMNVSADSAGSVALKKITFSLSVSTSGASTLSLSNFRLRKGSTNMPLADYRLTNASGTDLEAGSINNSQKIVVTFTNEESISGSGSTYTLVANVAGSVAGDSVAVSLFRDPAQTLTTGYLGDGALGDVWGPNIDTSVNGDNIADVVGTFVWSDNSEVPHSSATSTSASRDWTSDLYVEDMTQVQNLSR